MIEKLDQLDASVCEKIWQVWQASYAVEAELLNAVNFPPLKRTQEDFHNSNTLFLGFWNDGQLAAATELKKEVDFLHIQSLVVDPSYFRKGVAQQLLDYTFKHFPNECYMVETGVANHPAIALYLKNDFQEVKQWDTNHGIRKVRFEKLDLKKNQFKINER